MDNSVYISLSRQTAAFRKLDMVANNIANANTTGFLTEEMLFNDYLVDDGNGNKMAFTQDIATYHELRPGSLQVTGNQLDLAISGQGYFTVELPGGVPGYTRGGAFQIDGGGQIVNQDGLPLLDDAGQRIVLDEETLTLDIGENGIIISNGQEIGTIGIAEFNNRQNLVQLGGAVFDGQDQIPIPADNSRVLQGVLEESNVNAIVELVELTKLSRSTTDTAKFIEVMYDLQRKTGNAYAEQS